MLPSQVVRESTSKQQADTERNMEEEIDNEKVSKTFRHASEKRKSSKKLKIKTQ